MSHEVYMKHYLIIFCYGYSLVLSCCVPDVWEGMKRVKTDKLSNGDVVEIEVSCTTSLMNNVLM